jgi:hypothetical protein
MHVPPFGGMDPAGSGLGRAPHNKNFTRQTHHEEQLLFAGPLIILKANTPIGGADPAAPGLG